MKHGIHLHQLTVSAVERVALGERALMERSDLKIPDLLSLQVNHDDEDSLISMCGSCGSWMSKLGSLPVAADPAQAHGAAPSPGLNQRWNQARFRS